MSDPIEAYVLREVVINSEVNTLGHCNAVPKKKKETGKEPDMITYDDTLQARKYLNHEIRSLSETTHHDLSRKFHIEDDPVPEGGKELVQRILDGKYEIPDDERMSLNYAYGLRWRDPDKKPNKEGFEAAWESYQNAKQKTSDAAAVLTPAEGLAALDDLREFADELVHGKKPKK